MNLKLLPVLRGVLAQLRIINAPHALVGGLAVSARVEPRFTRDIDLVIAVADDQHAESVAGALYRAGYPLLTEFDHAFASFSC